MSLIRLLRSFPLPEGATSFDNLSARVKVNGGNTPIILFSPNGRVITRFGEVKLSAQGELDTYIVKDQVVSVDIFDDTTKYIFVTYQNISPFGDDAETAELFQEALDDGRAVAPARSFVINDQGLDVLVSGLTLKYRTTFNALLSTIDWGDGNVENVAKDLRTNSHGHTYAAPGTYVVRVAARIGSLIGAFTSQTITVEDSELPSDLPAILRAPSLTLADPSVGALYYVTDARIEGYLEGGDQDFVGVFGTIDGSDPPAPNTEIDWNAIYSFGGGYEENIGVGAAIPAEAEGFPIKGFIGIYNLDFSQFIYVYPVFTTTAVIGPNNLANLRPYPKTTQPLVLDPGDPFWSTEVFGASLYLPEPTSLTFRWFVNDVEQPQSFPWNAYNVSRSAMVTSGGIVPGDEIYCIVTATNANGSDVRQTNTVVATVENLATA